MRELQIVRSQDSKQYWVVLENHFSLKGGFTVTMAHLDTGDRTVFSLLYEGEHFAVVESNTAMHKVFTWDVLDTYQLPFADKIQANYRYQAYWRNQLSSAFADSYYNWLEPRTIEAKHYPNGQRKPISL